MLVVSSDHSYKWLQFRWRPVKEHSYTCLMVNRHIVIADGYVCRSAVQCGRLPLACHFSCIKWFVHCKNENKRRDFGQPSHFVSEHSWQLVQKIGGSNVLSSHFPTLTSPFHIPPFPLLLPPSRPKPMSSLSLPYLHLPQAPFYPVPFLHDSQASKICSWIYKPLITSTVV